MTTLSSSSGSDALLTANTLPRPASLLLNVGHALDHLFILIFATAVAAIARDFGFARWEDLMPYSVGAFLLFGLGAIPAGRLGDLWGRRPMMLVFFFGLAGAAFLTAFTQNAWQLAVGLTLIGCFSSIYHPVGIPMLVQGALRPGMVIGVNGLAGNMGVALAAILTGFLVQWFNWRMAFIVPGLIALGCGLLFLRYCPDERHSPSKSKKSAQVSLPPNLLARALLVMTMTAVTGSLLFNFTTNGNTQFLTERLQDSIQDPGVIGSLLALIYALASLTQLLVGRLIDKTSFRRLYLGIVLMQIPFLVLAAYSNGWVLLLALTATMVCIFGTTPFTDAMVVRYVDDRIRSRVAGARLAVSFGISSLAVWLLGPWVKAAGFTSLFVTMAAIACCTALVVNLLPSEDQATSTTI